MLNMTIAPATETTLASDLLAVVARINRLANQRVRLPLPFAQARLLSTIEAEGRARISDLAALDHCSQPTMTTQVRRLEDALRASTPAGRVEGVRHALADHLRGHPAGDDMSVLIVDCEGKA